MSLAENLLNSLDENNKNLRMGGTAEDEPHIIVDKKRSISVPNELKVIAVKGDKDVETVTIDCVRYWDGHDLSTFAIYLNYILPNGDEATYIPEEIVPLNDTFSFNWVIGREITQYQGGITFWIVAKLTDDEGELIKQWSSLQNSDLSVAQGGDKIYVPEKQTDQDVISQVLAVSTNAANRATEAVGKAESLIDSTIVSLEQTQVGEGDGGVNIWTATFANGETSNLVVKNGNKGADGLTPYIGTNGNWWIGNTDTKVNAEGNDGKDGENGKDGISPILKLVNGILSVSYDNGSTYEELGNVKGDKGEKGDSYIITEADKSEIVNDVLSALPMWEGGSY